MRKLQGIIRRKIESKKNRGFTMVELIIVIALIAALSIAAVIGYGQLTASATETLEKQEAAFIIRTVNQYNQFLSTSGYATDGIDTLTKLTEAKLQDLELDASNSMINLNLSIEVTKNTPNALTWIELGTPTAGSDPRVRFKLKGE